MGGTAMAQIMGILNVTPDSFSDGGLYYSVENAVRRAREMVREGADMIDIGGESTRPGSEPVSVEEELRRVLPVVEILAKELSVPLSIDTTKPEVAEGCLKLGVKILNDISGLRNPEMVRVAKQYNASVVIMHMLGLPRTMQVNIQYENVIEDIYAFLQKQASMAKEQGITSLIVDPGVGFGKTIEHNFMIIKHLTRFRELGCPVLIGPSRKSFIGKTLGLPEQERLEGTLAVVTACVLNGADIVRVHDVEACRRVMLIARTIKDA